MNTSSADQAGQGAGFAKLSFTCLCTLQLSLGRKVCDHTKRERGLLRQGRARRSEGAQIDRSRFGSKGHGMFWFFTAFVPTIQQV